MTTKAEQLEHALAALVLAADRFHKHRQQRPDDASGLGHLGAEVDRAASFLPIFTAREIINQLAEKSTVLVS